MVGSTTNLADMREPVTALLYGKEGTAKTTSVLQLAKLGRVVAINAEAGIKATALRRLGVPVENIEVWPPEDFDGPITFEKIEQGVYIPLRQALQADRDAYVGVCFDSFSEISQILTKEASIDSAERDRAKGKPRGRFQINVEDYGTSTQMIRTLLRMFRDLGIHVFITSLERRDQDDDGFVQYGPALGPAAATDVAGMVDCVIWTQFEEMGPNGVPFYTGTTRSRDRHRAKDRFGLLPIRMIEPTADRIIAYIHGDLTKQNDTRHQAAIAAVQPAPAA